MANKALVYAIYPNEKQNIQCQKTFGCCRFVYNHMLSLQQDRYKNGEKHLKPVVCRIISASLQVSWQKHSGN